MITYTLKKWIALIVCCLVVSGPLVAQTQTKLPGVVRAMRVNGLVSVKDEETKKVHRLTSGDILTEKYTLTTADASSVILIFSNGSTLLVDANTELSIKQFLQEPFKTNAEYVSQLEAEPSTSNTLLYLKEGKITGNVKRLSIVQGSSYDIATPIGVAGIRGTIFEMTVRPNEMKFAIPTGDAFLIPSIGNNDGQYFTVTTNNVAIVTDGGTQVNPLDPGTSGGIVDNANDASNNGGNTPVNDLQPGDNPVNINDPGDGNDSNNNGSSGGNNTVPAPSPGSSSNSGSGGDNTSSNIPPPPPTGNDPDDSLPGDGTGTIDPDQILNVPPAPVPIPPPASP
jgi:hypothetical protein